MPATGEGQQLQMSQISECLSSPEWGHTYGLITQRLAASTEVGGLGRTGDRQGRRIRNRLRRLCQDFGLVEMTGAEHVWYITQCIAFGAGYFAKIPTAKALSELPQFRSVRQSDLGTLAVGTASDSGPLPPPAAEPPSTVAPPVVEPAESVSFASHMGLVDRWFCQ